MRPLARGYIHQIAFFIALFASAVLLFYYSDPSTLTSILIYCISLVGMFGISALYHVPTWSRQKYVIMRRFDHASIFLLIAGTATPICLLSVGGDAGLRLLIMFWLFAVFGIIMTAIWSHGSKPVRAFFYIVMGWLGCFYFPQVYAALGVFNFSLLIIGGIIYTLGALIYAFKWPNPSPRVFGYHEIFHVLVVIASAFHFVLIARVATLT